MKTNMMAAIHFIKIFLKVLLLIIFSPFIFIWVYIRYRIFMHVFKKYLIKSKIPKDYAIKLAHEMKLKKFISR